MFRGNFELSKDNTGRWNGRLTVQTPRGPVLMTYSSEDDSRESALAVMGELMDGASYIPIHSLVGRGAAQFARKLHKAINTPEKRDGAMREYGNIAARAKTGNSRAQDVCYAVDRLEGEAEYYRHYQQRQGRIPNKATLCLLKPDTLVGNVYREAKKNPMKRAGVRLFNAHKNPKLRQKATEIRQALAQSNKRQAREIMGAYRDLWLAECEKRRQAAVAGVQTMGGFDFGNFLKDVGKVAGPVMKALAPVARFVPFVGPILEPAMNLASDAISKEPEAVRKVERINTLARAGVPKAIRAQTALKVAQKIKRAKAITDAIKTGALKPSEPKKGAAKAGPGGAIAALLAKNRQANQYQRGIREGIAIARRSKAF